MSCYITLCYDVLCYIALYHIISHYIMIYYRLLYYVILYYRGQLMALQLVLMRGGEGQSPRESSGDSCPW